MTANGCLAKSRSARPRVSVLIAPAVFKFVYIGKVNIKNFSSTLLYSDDVRNFFLNYCTLKENLSDALDVTRFISARKIASRETSRRALEIYFFK